ncbi:hypothetical protein DIPPA_08084 [Diplonema papillatum]|nr:hypothetical protein DIPPA_08084 [Diplonema papillatum]
MRLELHSGECKPFGMGLTMASMTLRVNMPHFSEAKVTAEVRIPHQRTSERLDLEEEGRYEGDTHTSVHLRGSYSDEGVTLDGSTDTDVSLAEVVSWLSGEMGIDVKLPDVMPHMRTTAVELSLCTVSGENNEYLSVMVVVDPGEIMIYASASWDALSVSACFMRFAITNEVTLPEVNLEFDLRGDTPPKITFRATLLCAKYATGDWYCCDDGVCAKGTAPELTLNEIVELGTQLTHSAYEMPGEMPHMTFPSALELSICSFDAGPQCPKGVTMRGMVTVEEIETQMIITITRKHISFVEEGRQTLLLAATESDSESDSESD